MHENYHVPSGKPMLCLSNVAKAPLRCYLNRCSLIKPFTEIKFVPLQFQPFPASDITLYYFKNMMTDFLARTHDLHPQIGGHYLKHATKNGADFIKRTKERLGQKAHMWFQFITIRYTLKVSHLTKIRKEFQRLWDEISIEQTNYIQTLWSQMGFEQKLLEKMLKAQEPATEEKEEKKENTPGQAPTKI